MLFPNILSFVKKLLQSRKSLHEIPEILSVHFVVVYPIPILCWRLKFVTIFVIFSAALTYCELIGSLRISQKLTKYETWMRNMSQIIEVNVHISPKATKLYFQSTKRTLYTFYTLYTLHILYILYSIHSIHSTHLYILYYIHSLKRTLYTPTILAGENR